MGSEKRGGLGLTLARVITGAMGCLLMIVVAKGALTGRLDFATVTMEGATYRHPIGEHLSARTSEQLFFAILGFGAIAAGAIAFALRPRLIHSLTFVATVAGVAVAALLLLRLAS